MEFELWLFAVKNLAQTYEMSQVIYKQLPADKKDELNREYRTTILGEKDVPPKAKKDDKNLKKLTELVYDFHNSMNVTERFLERNNIKKLDSSFPDLTGDPEAEFFKRALVELELLSSRVSIYLNYLSRPVTAEGDVERDEYGSYVLDMNPLTPGSLIEFMYNGRWEIGKLHMEGSTPYGYYITGINNEEFHVKLNGLHIRLR